MNKFKHSGTFGDLIYGLAMTKHFGGGEFYLHLNQVDWIGQHYYGSAPDPFHQGRMTEKDFEFMSSFMNCQTYIEKFDIMKSDTEITHNLDRFRPFFVGHPANYINTYCMAFGIRDNSVQNKISDGPWITVDEPVSVPNKPYVINRTARGFSPPGLNPKWTELKNQGIDEQAIFVGLPKEYEDFKKLSGWNLDYFSTKNMLDLAKVIAGCKQFIGNQSVALSIAQGLRVPYMFETRRDLPMDRNETYFPNHSDGSYF